MGDAVDTTSDASHGMIRTEVTCAKCGGLSRPRLPGRARSRPATATCMTGAALKFEEKK